MKIDERFMTIFTALFAVIGVGAVVTSGNGGLLGGSGTYEPQTDNFTVRAGRTQSLDVFLNDAGTDTIRPTSLTLSQPPRCGEAAVVDGRIEYTSGPDCDGSDTLAYCVPAGGECTPAEVNITILGDGQQRQARAMPRVIDRVTTNPQAPQGAADPQPMRLALPSADSAAPRPDTDARPQRSEANRVAAAEPAREATVTVARTSARSGSVDVAGADLDAPAAAENSAGVRIAGRDTRPGGASMPHRAPGLGLPGGMAEVRGPAFTRPDRPDETPGPRITDAGTPLRAPDESGEPARAPARLATPAAPAPDEQPMPEVTGTAIATADPAIPALPQRDSATLGAVPGNPASPAAPAPQQETALASLPQGGDSAPAARPGPAAPTVVEDIALAPDAQTGAPDAPIAEAPAGEEQSIMASLARSNTVLGVTVSAAKALFGPSGSQSAPDGDALSEAAPRPSELGQIAPLPAGPSPLEEDPAPVLGTAAGPEADPAPQRRMPVTVAALELKQPRGYARRTDIAARPAGLPLSGAPAAELRLPEIDPAAGGPQCDVDLALQVQVGGELLASLSSPCRPETRFLVNHAGLAFTANTDSDGVANFVVPALQSNAIVRVTFHDGASAVQRVMVESLARMTRVAVVWTDPLDVDLHAREFGAAEGADGDVRPDNPRDFRTARRIGGGYLTELGSAGEGAVRAQVYTIFETMRTGAGDVDFSLALTPEGATCPDSPVARVLRSERARITESRDFQLPFERCRAAELPGAGLSSGLEPVAFAEAR